MDTSPTDAFPASPTERGGSLVAGVVTALAPTRCQRSCSSGSTPLDGSESIHVPSGLSVLGKRKPSEGLPCCATHSRGQPDKHDLALSRFVAKTISQEQLLGSVVLARRVGEWWEWSPEGGGPCVL